MWLFDKAKNAIGSNTEGEEGEGDESVEESVETESKTSAGVFERPESFYEDRVSVPKRHEIILEHYDVTGRQAKTIAQTLKENLEDSDGRTHREIRTELESKVDLDEELLETIVWTETSSINLIETVEGYLENGREDDVYKLSVSDDGHPICTEARDEIEERGGVSLEEMTRILLEKADEHEDGTPERMDHWVPHERCKHSVIRHVE